MLLLDTFLQTTMDAAMRRQRYVVQSHQATDYQHKNHALWRISLQGIKKIAIYHSVILVAVIQWHITK